MAWKNEPRESKYEKAADLYNVPKLFPPQVSIPLAPAMQALTRNPKMRQFRERSAVMQDARSHMMQL